MCALYGVTRVGYYAWRHRGESARRRRDRSLVDAIRGLFEQSRGTYGSPRIPRALVATGERVSRRRVERLMREAGLRARAMKLYRRIPGLHGFFTSIPNRQLDRLATGPDQVWVGDITYLKVVGAWRYLAVVMDRCLGPQKDARLTLRALNHAVAHRRPRPGVVFHSDRGVEYAAYAFRHRLAALGFVQSMNRPREVTDNAYMESFFHSCAATCPTTTAYGCTPGSATLHPSPMRRRRGDRIVCLQNRGKIPALRAAAHTVR